MMHPKEQLKYLAENCAAEVLGVNRIDYDQHAKLLCTALQAFGDDERATFFIEGQEPTGTIPRPDLIILHPEIGVLVIENKGIGLDDIHQIHDTNLSITRSGRLKEEDPFKQAEAVMFGLRDLCAKRFQLHNALFLRTVALPKIRRYEFEERFQIRWPAEALFADACANPAIFRKQILALAEAGQQVAHKHQRLSKYANDQIMTILRGRGPFYTPRPTPVESDDHSLLGVQAQDLELALKPPTQQQMDLGKADLRGSHRLFRGVAGSGKSIMLALSVAHTLKCFREEQETLFGKQPQQRILVVCFNRSLVQYLRSKIEDRYVRLVWDRPSPDQLTILHMESLVKGTESSQTEMSTGLGFKQRSERARALCENFDKLPDAGRDTLQYDAVYVDEAQDLVPEELEFLRRLARKSGGGKQTLIIFYDNAQNIYGVTPPTWSDLGIQVVGGRTVFLDTCLRNTTETLTFALNVLVGAYAAEGQRATTKQFADVAGLKQRHLVTECDNWFDIHFSRRNGAMPTVREYPHRHAEIDGTADLVKWLINDQKVLPSDILILYKSHYSFGPRLIAKLEASVGNGCHLREVNATQRDNKNLPLIEDGVLTLSTIASAKGYDAPIVILIGADELATDSQGRASFYVAATRAKMNLYISGIKTSESGLLGESMMVLERMKHNSAFNLAKPTSKDPPGKEGIKSEPVSDDARFHCKHCGGRRLHAQHGKFGYYFQCIDCTRSTDFDATCARCGKKGRIRKSKRDFSIDCEHCQTSVVVHTNVQLSELED